MTGTSTGANSTHNPKSIARFSARYVLLGGIGITSFGSVVAPAPSATRAA